MELIGDIVSGIFGLLGVGFGFFLATIQANRSRKERVATNWAALSTQLQICSQLARKFLENMIEEDDFFKVPREDKWRNKTPDFRLPANAYNVSVTSLVADHAITNDEVTALANFYGRVETLNRGLDQAVAIRRADPTNGQGWEFGDQLECNCTYALDLVPQRELKVLPLKKVATSLPAQLRDNHQMAASKPTLFDEAWAACKRHNDALV